MLEEWSKDLEAMEKQAADDKRAEEGQEPKVSVSVSRGDLASGPADGPTGGPAGDPTGGPGGGASSGGLSAGRSRESVLPHLRTRML